MKYAWVAILLLKTFSLLAQPTARDLNGTWSFRTDPTDKGEAEGWFNLTFSTQNWDNMPVPGNWDLRNEYAHYVGKGWYRRTFEASPDWENKVVRVVFESVYHDSKVWLNGQLLGENHLGFLPFEFEIAQKLNYNGLNTLVVCADNTFRRGAIWNWGGIRRPVTLQINDGIRIARQHVTPTVDLAAGTGSVAVEIFLQNHTNQAKEVRGELLLSDKKLVNKTLPFSQNVPANSISEVIVKTEFAKNEVRLWHFDAPNLYDATAKLEVSNETNKTRFGFRRIEIDNAKHAFKLNGESVRLVGYNLVPDDRTNGSTFPTWRIKEDIDLLKQAGTNMCRVSHMPLPEEVLDYLDERGIMTFEEVSLWGYDRFADPAEPLAKEWLNRLIIKEYNHPSVIGWSVGNEIGDYPTVLKYVEGAIQDAHRQDSTRLAVTISHTANRPHDILQFSDLGTINKYGKNLAPVTRQQHQNYPNKTLFYTEFGIGQLNETLDTDLDAKALMDSIRFLPYLVGGSLWTFNDYRSLYFGTKEYSENRPWGVVDVYRQKKRAFVSVQREFAPVKTFAVSSFSATSAQVIIAARTKYDLPAFTLKNYRVVWQLLDIEGKTIQTGFQKLATLLPDAATVSLPISWKVAPNAAALKVELVSPTQYAVRDTTVFLQKPNKPAIKEILTYRTYFNGIQPKSGAIRVWFNQHTSATEYKLKYGENGLTQESPLTISNHLEISNLEVGESYQIALVSVNAAGEDISETQIVKIENQLAPPIIQYDEAKNVGFSVGYDCQDNDYLYRVQVTTQSGDYAKVKIVQTTNLGTLHVNGLENGKTYFYRLQKR